MEIREKNKASVKSFFTALETKNMNVLLKLFANEAKHINPYHSGIFPEGANGKEEIENYWKPVFENFDGMTFPLEYLYAMEDHNMVFVKYKGYIKLKNSSKVYSNEYYSTFKFNRDGQIIEYVEIFNPILAAKGFGLLGEIQP
ncbi:nuclear transport factor 2 family protein [Seonamhaeicola marinus]|uniref:Nuclear transport factor 2 family protein n=2 Tax=Seonamhaeicola marinus TaxID=1912246 RepID=A0A5D0H476_9FLAO|nr:nuclear transport factor 2 family protein [Seonamhaeicola marinus]